MHRNYKIVDIIDLIKVKKNKLKASLLKDSEHTYGLYIHDDQFCEHPVLFQPGSVFLWTLLKLLRNADSVS